MNIDTIINRHFNTDKGFNYLVDFIKIKFPNLSINEENLKTLKIIRMSKEKFIQTSFSGLYNYDKNTIEVFTNLDENGNKIFNIDISDEELINTFLHELIHALTSMKDNDNNIIEGLNIRNPEGINSIFLAINEGITQMITDDILGKESDAYPFETTFARQLALIIGKDKLINLYSTNAYELFVDTLEKIGSNVNIYNLINKIFCFNFICKGMMADGGYYLGNSIQKDLIDLYKASGIKEDIEFEKLLLDSSKINKYMGYLPVSFISMKDLGFDNIDIIINDFKERKK